MSIIDAFFINQETYRIDNVVRWDTGSILPTVFLDYLVLPAEEGFWLGDFYDPETGRYIKGPPPQSGDAAKEEDNKKLKEIISNLNNSQTTDLP